MPVRFHNDDVRFMLRNKRLYQSFLEEQFFRITGKMLDIQVVFCSDSRLLDINRQFLKHDYYTDIITFPLHEGEDRVMAELYISLDRVDDHAQEFGVSRVHELNRVIFHGVLHLCGLKDKTERQQKEMRQAEEEWLKVWANELRSHSLSRR